MTRRAIVGLVSLAALMTSAGAAADPDPAPPPKPEYLRMRGETEICYYPERTHCLILLPGRYIEESHFLELDTEMRRLQDQETRLTAENGSLRKSQEGWQPGWKTVVTVLAVGIATGVYIGLKF